MNFVNRTEEGGSAQNPSQKKSTENRKNSRDSYMLTNENTPKSEKLNIIKIGMNEQPSETK
jgi:hypothetical protein